VRTLVELCLACAIVALVTLLSRQLQSPTTVVVWDAGQYYRVTNQFASGSTPYAESPYVFRVAIPWLVAKRWPSAPSRGFLLINLASAFAIAVLLVLWLRAWALTGWIPIAIVGLVAAAWHGPMRYLFYNPGYVDPPFLALLLAGLLLIRSIEQKWSAAKIALLAVLVAAGALVRETMMLVPLCLVMVNGPVGAWLQGRRRSSVVPAWALALPLLSCAAAIVFTHRIVSVDTTERASMLQAAMQWLHKSPDQYVMGWLTAFGPVLAIVLFDWRRALRLLADHEWLAALLAGCVALSFFGGSDTERFAFWSLPVVYLLLARAIEHHAGVLRSTLLVTALVVSQAIAARVFWGIPDPRAESVVGLALNAGWRDRIYGIANRLFVIDSFHFNLWSSFGSRPFRLLRIALYLAVTGGLIWVMQRRARHAEIALRPLARAGHGHEHGGIVE
jgi:hypothetical protein